MAEEEDEISSLFSSSSPSARFEKPGDKIEGVVVGISTLQDRDFSTKEPLTWPDGKPKMMLVLELQTQLKDSDEDDGLRSVWCRGNIHTAVKDAVRKAASATKRKGDNALVMNGLLKLRLDKLEPSGKGAPRKIYAAKLEPGEPPAAAAEPADNW